ncbi:MAG: hypothetical protein ACI4QT_03625, partial [Kiritimatiellia bacterium]
MPVEPLWQSSIGADGVLRCDSSRTEFEFEWRKYAQTSKDEPLKPNTRYEITFRAKVEGMDKGSYLYAIIRPESTGGAEKDVGDLPVHPTDGQWRACKMKFSTGSEPDYRLQFHSHNRIKAEIADLEIKELEPVRHVTCVPGNSRVERPAGLPAGAQEFDVDLPRAKKGLVLDAVAFGVHPENPDNTDALRKVFAEAKMRGAEKLVLAPG